MLLQPIFYFLYESFLFLHVYKKMSFFIKTNPFFFIFDRQTRFHLMKKEEVKRIVEPNARTVCISPVQKMMQLRVLNLVFCQMFVALR